MARRGIEGGRRVPSVVNDGQGDHVDETSRECAASDRVFVGRNVFALAMQAASSPVHYAATSSDSAVMDGPDQARVSIYDFGTHETTTYIVDIPAQFEARVA